MTRPHLRRRWGLVIIRPVESVGVDEPVQQSARVGVRSLVDDGDQRDYEVRVGEISVPSEARDAGPDAGVAHRVLVGVVPLVGDLQWLNGVNAAVVSDLDDGPVPPGAGDANVVGRVDGIPTDLL